MKYIDPYHVILNQMLFTYLKNCSKHLNYCSTLFTIILQRNLVYQVTESYFSIGVKCGKMH